MEKIAIGVILSPFGKEGWCKVKSFSGESSHFEKLKEIEARSQQQTVHLMVDEVRAGNKLVFLKFRGCDDIDSARKLQNAEIVVSRKYAQELEKNEYYFQDLHGCDVILDNELVGRITGFIETGAQCLIEVKTKDNRTVLVPFIKEFIGKVDIKKKKIELLEGFILS
ncbi:MAG: 16S rRNA processing protein RimM [Spirochaetales bacterium]|nr:16S rRNA processing protein RimM [Spirochaetales bacterium]